MEPHKRRQQWPLEVKRLAEEMWRAYRDYPIARDSRNRPNILLFFHIARELLRIKGALHQADIQEIDPNLRYFEIIKLLRERYGRPPPSSQEVRELEIRAAIEGYNAYREYWEATGSPFEPLIPDSEIIEAYRKVRKLLTRRGISRLTKKKIAEARKKFLKALSTAQLTGDLLPSGLFKKVPPEVERWAKILARLRKKRR